MLSGQRTAFTSRQEDGSNDAVDDDSGSERVCDNRQPISSDCIVDSDGVCDDCCRSVDLRMMETIFQ